MTDKLTELEKRMERLEDKFKASLLEVEKRLESMKTQETPVVVVEQKMQELEDLVLLLQLEVTKLKDVTGGGYELAGTPNTSDIYTRVRKVEEDVKEIKVVEPEKSTEEVHSINKQLDDIEKRLGRLEKTRHSGTGVLEDVRKILHA